MESSLDMADVIGKSVRRRPRVMTICKWMPTAQKVEIPIQFTHCTNRQNQNGRKETAISILLDKLCSHSNSLYYPCNFFFSLHCPPLSLSLSRLFTLCTTSNIDRKSKQWQTRIDVHCAWMTSMSFIHANHILFYPNAFLYVSRRCECVTAYDI